MFANRWFSEELMRIIDHGAYERESWRPSLLTHADFGFDRCGAVVNL
jgi:hypothetical protein